MLKVCEVCGTEFKAWKKKQRSCSQKCGKVLQKQTMGDSPNTKHGFAREGKVERLHGIWRGILKRCFCKTHGSYKGYGERGITVCKEWTNDYVAFRTWCMCNGYHEDLSIDRINNNGDYEPSNCKWSTKQQQANNRRTSTQVVYKSMSFTIAEASRIWCIPYATLSARIKKLNWSVEDAIETPVQGRDYEYYKNN